MKIIKQGQLPSEKVYQTQCRTCQTVFEFTRGEAKYNDAYDQREPAYLSIHCPLCHAVAMVGL